MTELYDGDHGINDLDRARAEAVAAGEASGAGWAGTERYELIMREMREQVGAMVEHLERLLAGELGDGPDAPLATSARFLDELEKYHPAEEDLAEGAQCPICIVKYEAEDAMHVLPCAHTFHPDCVLPWLRKSNTCPVCRDELPSDDPRWEERKERERKERDREADLERLHDGMFG